MRRTEECHWYGWCRAWLAGETLQGLRENLKSVMESLNSADSSVSVLSGCELFLRSITLTKLDEEVCNLFILLKLDHKFGFSSGKCQLSFSFCKESIVICSFYLKTELLMSYV